MTSFATDFFPRCARDEEYPRQSSTDRILLIIAALLIAACSAPRPTPFPPPAREVARAMEEALHGRCSRHHCRCEGLTGLSPLASEKTSIPEESLLATDAAFSCVQGTANIPAFRDRRSRLNCLQARMDNSANLLCPYSLCPTNGQHHAQGCASASRTEQRCWYVAKIWWVLPGGEEARCVPLLTDPARRTRKASRTTRFRVEP